MIVKLEIMDYANRRYDTGFEFELDDLKFLFVEVVSGDEILMPYFQSGELKRFDSMDFANGHRIEGFYDGCYTVSKEDFEEWNKRKDTYEFLWILRLTLPYRLTGEKGRTK